MIELEYLEAIRLHGETDVDLWSIQLDSQQVGTVQVGLVTPELLGVEDIFVKKEFRSEFGPQGVRRVLQLLKEEYPGITEVAGIRISGIRARSAPIEPETGERELPMGTAQLVRRRI